MTTSIGALQCPCGVRLECPQLGADRSTDLLCSCGRHHEARRRPEKPWAIIATLTPERSVPISGFSREIRSDPRAERFHFSHWIGGSRIPVHIIYSASSRAAEIKAAGMKAAAYSDVEGPLEARRRWVDRFETRARSLKSGPNRLAHALQREHQRGSVSPS